MDRAQVDRWLERYVEAWKSYEREQIAALFSEDAEYRYHSYDEPLRGRDRILDDWLENRDDAGTYDASYRAVAVDGDVGVATGSSTYLSKDGSVATVYDNCFVMRFDEEGRCRDFTEWYVKRSPVNVRAPRPGRSRTATLM